MSVFESAVAVEFRQEKRQILKCQPDHGEENKLLVDYFLRFQKLLQNVYLLVKISRDAAECGTKLA